MTAKAIQHSRRNYLPLLLLFLLLVQTARANTSSVVFSYVRPPNCSDEMLSTDWWDEVRCVLPTNLWAGKNLDFKLATNGLAQESKRGNIAAQGLWGFVIVNCTSLKSPHPDWKINDGLQLMENSATQGCIPSMSRLAKLCTSSPVVVQDYNEAFHWYTTAAARGDAMSQLHLGGCYYHGWGTAPDPAKAAEYYRQAAAATNYMAMKDYGCLLMDGIGVPPDLGAATQWFLRAAKEGGNRRAMNNLAVIYSRNLSDSNAMAQAFYWFKQSAELGDALGCLQLATFYYHGWGVTETNLDAYRKWRLQAATLGATEAQYEMALACRLGDGVPVNLPEAIRWYTRAAAKNHPAALYDLAVIYRDAKNASLLDLNTSAGMMRRAAEGGHRQAQLEYALDCFHGNGVPADCVEGDTWLSRAAESGWGPAEYDVFDIFYHGSSPSSLPGPSTGPLVGVTNSVPDCPAFAKDVPTAMKLLHRAAGHGDYQAQSILALTLLQSTDPPPDRVAAEKWLRNAAMHGYAPGMNDLGFAIFHGDLNDRDLVESALWCKLAADHAGDPSALQLARNNTDLITPHLSAAQMTDLNHRLASFQLLPPEKIDPLPSGWENNAAYQQEDGIGDH